MKQSILLILLLPACTIRPLEITHAGGGITRSLGGSLLTKSQQSTASYIGADGTSMSYSETGKDEVTGARALMQSYAGVKIAGFLRDSTIAKDKGDVAVAKKEIQSGTEKAAIAADVEKTKITAETAETAIESGVPIGGQ